MQAAKNNCVCTRSEKECRVGTPRVSSDPGPRLLFLGKEGSVRIRFYDTLKRMSPTKLLKYTLWADKKLLDQLRALSKKTRIPASALVREGIEFVVQKYRS